jgi:predicted amidohydrolase YtcJ
MDGHMGVANSLALKIAGVTRETPDPIGGAIPKNYEGGIFGIILLVSVFKV